MTDIKVDSASGDLVFDGFDLAITQDIPDQVAQRILIRLRSFLGEWFLDEGYGIDYYGSIFGKNRSKDSIDIIIKNAILDDDNVDTILEYRSSLNNRTRSLKIDFKVRSVSGEVTPLINLSM